MRCRGPAIRPSLDRLALASSHPTAVMQDRTSLTQASQRVRVRCEDEDEDDPDDQRFPHWRESQVCGSCRSDNGLKLGRSTASEYPFRQNEMLFGSFALQAQVQNSNKSEAAFSCHT
jgi:hypothetical protein